MTPGINPSQPQLRADEIEGSPFYINGGSYYIILTGHSGGTCYLDVEAPDQTWVESDISFTSNGVKTFVGTQLLRYRLRVDGGAVGAQAWVMPAYSQGQF